jgi:hypothetical protein
MRSNPVTVLGAGMGEDPLDKIVAILVAGNVNQGDTGAIYAAFADLLKVAVDEVVALSLQALLNHLGGVLVHAVLRSKADDVVESAALIGRGTLLADVLDAPIAKLAMGNNVNVGQDLLDARSLE